MIRGKHVVYLALQPPPEAAAEALARLEAHPQRRRLTTRPSAPNRLHVSMFGIGEFKRPPTPVFDKVMEAVSAIDVRRFAIEFNRLGTWGRSEDTRPIVLWGDEGVIGAQALYSALHKALRRVDMAPRREPEFEPHLTLAWDKAEIAETAIAPVRWIVDELVLIHAVHGEGRQDMVGRLPLA